jgi:hypothetical protein
MTEARGEGESARPVAPLDRPRIALLEREWKIVQEWAQSYAAALIAEKDAEIERLRRACEFLSTPPEERALAQIKEAKAVAYGIKASNTGRYVECYIVGYDDDDIAAAQEDGPTLYPWYEAAPQPPAGNGMSPRMPSEHPLYEKVGPEQRGPQPAAPPTYAGPMWQPPEDWLKDHEIPALGSALQKLGSHLADMLSEDDWNNIEQMLFAVARESATPQPPVGRGQK